MISLHARSLPSLAAVLVLVTTLLVSGRPALAADAGAEARFVALVNQERAGRGLPALMVSDQLRSVARRHSAQMAQQQRLHHNPSLASECAPYRRIGENVGYGGTVDEVHQAFMASASHRQNIVSDGYTQIGVGVERRDGTLWVTQVFRLPQDGADPPPAAPPSPPSPGPPAAPPAPVPPADPDPLPEPASDHLRLVFARVDAVDSGGEVVELVAKELTAPSEPSR